MDAEQASQWVKNMPLGASRDAAARSYVEAINAAHPERAAEWISSFGNSEQVPALIEIVALRWMPLNPAAAATWLAKTALPESRKQELLQVR